MIGTRRLMIFGWGFEAGMRIRVIHPSKAAKDAEIVTVTERAARQADLLRFIDRQRMETERRWIEIGGR